MGIERRSRRRVALISALHVREETAFEYWECGRLERIYEHQRKLFGSDVVHEDCRARTTLFGSVESSSMSSPATVVHLKSSVLGGLKPFRQWSLGALFDPGLCKESVAGLVEVRSARCDERALNKLPNRRGVYPFLCFIWACVVTFSVFHLDMSPFVVFHVDMPPFFCVPFVHATLSVFQGRGSGNTSTLDQLLKHDAPANVGRALTLDRMRTTCKCQALEKAVLVASVTHNFVVLEALECVEVLGVVELVHRGGGATLDATGDATTGDATFITNPGTQHGKHHGKKPPTAAALRYHVKQERHKLHACFLSAYQPRLDVYQDTLLAYKEAETALHAKHRDLAEATAGQQSWQSGTLSLLYMLVILVV